MSDYRLPIHIFASKLTESNIRSLTVNPSSTYESAYSVNLMLDDGFYVTITIRNGDLVSEIENRFKASSRRTQGIPKNILPKLERAIPAIQRIFDNGNGIIHVNEYSLRASETEWEISEFRLYMSKFKSRFPLTVVPPTTVKNPLSGKPSSSYDKVHTIKSAPEFSVMMEALADYYEYALVKDVQES